MFFFKLLFLVGVIHTELPPEAAGWVAIERREKEKPAHGADETDPSIWVVFAKKIGTEKFLVSFPAEPTYKYLKGDGSEMELSVAAGGSEHLLQVLAPREDLLNARKMDLKGAIQLFEQVDEKGAVDIVYWKDGYWFMERLVTTEKHSYILQTKNGDFEGHSHRQFATSLDIEY